jgi:hypothetical protein
MENEVAKVLLAIPTWGGLHHKVAMAAMSLCRHEQAEPLLSNGRPISHNRNVIVRKFLAGDWTHLFFIDSDTRPPEDVLDKLLSLEAEVATGCYPVWDGGLFWALYEHVLPDLKTPLMRTLSSNQPFQVRGAGAGCLLIRREVLEKLEFPWFQEQESPDGTLRYEDQWFFNACHERGIRVMAHPGVICDHFKQINLADLLVPANVTGE